eukprot:5482679-Amphidinium_carterae.1
MKPKNKNPYIRVDYHVSGDSFILEEQFKNNTGFIACSIAFYPNEPKESQKSSNAPTRRAAHKLLHPHN